MLFLRFSMSLLCLLDSFGGVLKGFLGLFVSTQVVPFPMMLHRTPVSVRRKLMKFGGFAMRIVHVVDLKFILASA